MARWTPNDERRVDDALRKQGLFPGGLAELGERFEYEGASGWWRTRVHLTLRAPPRLRYLLQLRRANRHVGVTFAGLPKAPSLSDDALRAVDDIVAAKTHILVEPLNGTASIVDGASGIAGFVPWDADPHHRHLGHRAVFYFPRPDWEHSFRCIWIDLDAGRLEGLMDIDAIHDAPERPRVLSEAEFTFVDTAMRAHGDFGVYGDVTDGLKSLVRHMDVSLTETADGWHISAYPHHGHGHFLQFTARKPDGRIDGAISGHVAPPPIIEEGWDAGDADLP